MIRLLPGEKEVRWLVKSWLALALFSMLSSTIYAFLLVITRSGLQSGNDTTFKTALVLHVTFSVLIWFYSITGIGWSMYSGKQMLRAGWLAFGLACSGAFLIALSPLLAENRPVLNDYIPVLDQPVFYLAMVLFAGGIIIAAIRVLLTVYKGPRPKSYHPIPHSLKASAIITLTGCMLIPLAWITGQQAGTLDLQRLFWGSGHILLLSHLLIMFTAWLWLTPDEHNGYIISSRIKTAINSITLLALVSPLLYLTDQSNPGHFVWQSLFTWIMAIAGVIALYLIVHIILNLPGKSWLHNRWQSIVVPAATLFLLGSMLGFLIDENNAMVPAHYHGVIGAITLSFMGLVYALLPGIGYVAPSRNIIMAQSMLYSLGLAIMMLGLVLSDVPRKTIGKNVSNGDHEMLGHILTGSGGIMALLGCCVFLLLVSYRLFSTHRSVPLTSELS